MARRAGVASGLRMQALDDYEVVKARMARFMAAAFACLRGYVEASELPFAALRIARHGEVLAEVQLSGIETVDADSRYRIYSITAPGRVRAVNMPGAGRPAPASGRRRSWGCR